MHTYRNYLLYSIVVLFSGLLFLICRWPRGRNYTFSQHAAGQRSSILYYIALFATALPMLYIFFWKYFVPHYKLPALTLGLIGASATAQIGCTLVPEIGDRHTTVHRVLAGLSAVLLPPVLLILLMSPPITLLDKLWVGAAFVLMTGVIGATLYTKQLRLPALLLQATYFTVFFAALAIVTY